MTDPAGNNFAGVVGDGVLDFTTAAAAAAPAVYISEIHYDNTGGLGEVVFAYPANGIQNGSPDGIALVHGSTVVQFLSY